MVTCRLVCLSELGADDIAIVFNVVQGGRSRLCCGDRHWLFGGSQPIMLRRRPSMLEFRSAADVIVTGVTFQNAPYWALHPYNCTRFSAVGVRWLPTLNPMRHGTA